MSAMTAIQVLRALYQNPTAAGASWKQDGGSVVGYITPDVPEELLIAGGLLPLRLKGDPNSPAAKANTYVRQSFNPYLLSIFDRILDLTYGFLASLILSNLDESVVRVYYYLREMQRLDRQPEVPPLHYFEFLHLKSESSFRYDLNRMQVFKQQVEQWSATSIANDNLRWAISLTNEKRRLLAELADYRKQQMISGVDALQIIGCSMLMDVSAYNQLLDGILHGLHEPESGAKARIFVAGSSLDNVQLYELIESCDALVVDEDSDWANDNTDHHINESDDPIASITDFYFNRRPYPTKATIAERAAYCLKRAQNAQADGVIFFIYQGDHTPHWDYPEQRKALETHGIPSLYLPMQPYMLGGQIDLQAQIRTFIQSLHISERLH